LHHICFSFQKALDEGRLKFGDKSKQLMQVDANPLKKTDFMNVEIVDINMVEISEEIVAGDFAEAPMPIDTKMVTEDHQVENVVVIEDQFTEKNEGGISKG